MQSLAIPFVLRVTERNLRYSKEDIVLLAEEVRGITIQPLGRILQVEKLLPGSSESALLTLFQIVDESRRRPRHLKLSVHLQPSNHGQRKLLGEGSGRQGQILGRP